MKSRFRKLALATLPLTALTLGAIGTAAAEDCEVRIGAAGPMTGGAAQWGLAFKAATDFEAAWTNEHGGVQIGDKKCKVVVYSYDSKYTVSGGAEASNYFASQNIHAVIGPVGSPENTGFKPVAKRNGQINFNPSAAPDAIGPEFPLDFHEIPQVQTWGPLLLQEAKKSFKFNNAIVIGANDQGGMEAAHGMTKLYQASAIPVSEEVYDRGTINFAPLATRLMGKNPDLVELAGMPPGDVALLVRQLLDAGYTGLFGRGGGAGVADIIKGLGGPERLKGIFWIEYVPLDDPRIQQLRDDFKRIMKTDPPESTLFIASQTAAEQIFKAMTIAGTDQDGDKLADALRNMTPVSRYRGTGGWRGKTLYGINQEFAFPAAMGVIKNGKVEHMVPIAIPTEK